MEKRSGELSRIFKYAAIGVLFTIAASPLIVEGVANKMDDDRKGGVPLTAGEKALAYSIFGNQIATDKIRKHNGPKQPLIAASVAAGSKRHIDFWGEANQSEDFSKERNWKQYVFVHEMTHIWQHQNNWALVMGITRGCKEYNYVIKPDSHFDDFCVEQQATIVGNYVRYILYPSFGAPSIHSEDNRQLARVVEEKFPAAQVTRESIQKKHIENQNVSLKIKSDITI